MATSLRMDQRLARRWAAVALAPLVAGALLNGGQAMAQANDTRPATGAAVAGDYLLAAGDVVRISVYQNPDLSIETRLTESGVISFPLVGPVRLGGLGVAAAERAIAEGLRNGNFVKQPQVTLVVVQVRGHQANVLGQVNRPGRFALESPDLRLSDLLALAGGATPSGADRVTLVGLRDGRPYRLEVDLPTLFAAEGRAQDALVRHGDTLWVDRQPLIYIYGEVQRPGAMRLERDQTLLQTLAAGGGLTLRGTEKGIRVHRRGQGGALQVLTPGMDDLLLPGDVVYVRESLF